mmetsp:Transcript_85575/g.151514  ORF Transcript_85575/g.151514 Transcript_85575/m.151514 type:complete len:91 (+) Transcript_85575:283-555(+)
MAAQLAAADARLKDIATLDNFNERCHVRKIYVHQLFLAEVYLLKTNYEVNQRFQEDMHTDVLVLPGVGNAEREKLENKCGPFYTISQEML